MRFKSRSSLSRKGEPLTPLEITPAIKSFCAELDPTYNPLYLKVSRVKGALRLECHDNVVAYIQSHGGQQRCGWTLSKYPVGVLSAISHSVWISPDDQLVDITPDSVARHLFLPSSRNAPNWLAPKAIYRATSDDPRANVLVEVLTENEAVERARGLRESGIELKDEFGCRQRVVPV
jgi:hypothetical protein